jgi:hypothetical protein
VADHGCLMDYLDKFYYRKKSIFEGKPNKNDVKKDSSGFILPAFILVWIKL